MITLCAQQLLLRLPLLLTSLATSFKSNVKKWREDLVFEEREKKTVRVQETKMEAQRRRRNKIRNLFAFAFPPLNVSVQ